MIEKKHMTPKGTLLLTRQDVAALLSVEDVIAAAAVYEKAINERAGVMMNLTA